VYQVQTVKLGVRQLPVVELEVGVPQVDSHVQYKLPQCAQRMYLIKLLHHKGMPQRQLSVVIYPMSRVYCILSQHGEVSSVMGTS